MRYDTTGLLARPDLRYADNPSTVQTIRHQVSGTRQSVEMTLLSLPLYLEGQLGRLLDQLRQER